MARAPGCAVLLLVANLAVPVPAQQPIFVEVDAVPVRVFVQQVFDVVVRLGIDRQWLADHAVPLLQQRLDRPFHVEVPWLSGDDAHDGAPLLPAVSPAAPPTTLRLAVGDRVLPFTVAGERQVDGRAFELLELRCRLSALQAGELALPPVVVRYAFGTRFQNDFLRGRQALDRVEARVVGEARVVMVAALPAAPPPGFGGAVGSFVLAASFAAVQGEVGVSVACTLELTGTGNFDRMQPPAALTVPGFHVQGITTARSAQACRFVLDLLPLRTGTTVGPLSLVVFEPVPGQYTTLRTAPVAFAVGPASAPDQLSPRVRELIVAAADAADRWPPWWVWAAAATLLGAVVASHRRRAARAGRGLATALVARLAAALPHDPMGALAALDAWLANRRGSADFDAERDWSSLQAAGVSAATVAELQRVRAALDAARYGGVAPAAATVLAVLSRARP